MAFAYSSLRDVTIPKTVITIKHTAFKGCPIQYCILHYTAYNGECPYCHSIQVEHNARIDNEPNL
ncbi:MAG: hypothetical protein IJ244_02820 [Bacteroidaceae bacterium]|nr:hypothetical protein [Bacteroidaceae bacterium]